MKGSSRGADQSLAGGRVLSYETTKKIKEVPIQKKLSVRTV